MDNIIVHGNEANDVLLEMRGITKVYSNGFVANKNITFSVRKGEIHGLVGENGAGKTTLMKVLFGQEPPEEGEIFFDNKKINIGNPLQALECGIGMVHQHFMLVPSLTVAENMVLGYEPKKGKTFFDYNEAVRLTREISEKYELPVNPDMRISDLSVGLKQRVEILRILLRGVRLILLDEPTAILTPQETKELFTQLKRLKEQGNTIVFISHKLNEIREICDRITVLRKGEVIGTEDIHNVSEADIARMMVGRDVYLNIGKDNAKPGRAVLSLRDISYKDKNNHHVLKNISLDVHSGEIVGIAGVEGNGQSELCEIISGILPATSGDITIEGTSITGKSVREIREIGAALVHEDRMTYGVSVDASVKENLISDRYYKKEFAKRGLMRQAATKANAQDLIKQFQIKCDSENAAAKTLSGGNIQKVVVAREFSSSPRFMLVSHPTRGIDIGSAELIRKKIVQMRDEQNVAILMTSADFTELLSVSDKIIVLFDGEIVAYFPDAKETNASILGEYMLGLKKQDLKGVVNSVQGI